VEKRGGNGWDLKRTGRGKTQKTQLRGIEIKRNGEKNPVSSNLLGETAKEGGRENGTKIIGT